MEKAVVKTKSVQGGKGGDERRGECSVLQVREGRAGRKRPHLSGEPPGWPSRINLCGVHHTQEQLTLLTQPSTAPGRSAKQALPLKQSTTAETCSDHPGTAGRDMVRCESRRSVGAPGPGEPQNQPRAPSPAGGQCGEGPGAHTHPRGSGLGVPLCSNGSGDRASPCAHSPSGDGAGVTSMGLEHS